MNTFFSARRLRWAAPAVVAAAIAGAALTTNVAANASGQPKLDTRTAAQLLSAVEEANPAGLSGTVVETAKLGLPSLPSLGGSSDDSSLSLQNLITGSHTLRVWEAGSKKQRIALLGQLSESDVVHNGTDLWTYSSTTSKVTHNTLKDSGDTRAADRASGVLTPQHAAEQALAAIDPSTTVDVDSTARVAGRPAYQLSLLPKDSRSLIGSVRIAIDSATSVPLRVQVFAKGATNPAIDIGFTDISFAVPSASIFTFVPPAGTTVTEKNLPFGFGGAAKTARAGTAIDDTRDSSSSTKIFGTGWTSVAEVTDTGVTAPGQPGPADSDTRLLDQLSTPVAGGRAISTALVSVFITDEGRIFAGPVSVAALQQVARTGKGL